LSLVGSLGWVAALARARGEVGLRMEAWVDVKLRALFLPWMSEYFRAFPVVSLVVGWNGVLTALLHLGISRFFYCVSFCVSL
jgi:hypothetical protein